MSEGNGGELLVVFLGCVLGIELFDGAQIFEKTHSIVIFDFYCAIFIQILIDFCSAEVDQLCTTFTDYVISTMAGNSKNQWHFPLWHCTR